MDPTYAKRIGVNIDELLVSQPDTGEQALEITELLVRSGALAVVAIDSVAALDAEGRDRGRDGRLPRRPAGPADVAGAAQAHRHAQPHRHDLHLHEPAAREDRRHVRQPRDDAGRPGAQVLRVGAPRHPPHRDAQGRRRGDRQPRARQGREEQGRAAVQAGRVRHHLRRGHPLGGHRPRHGDRAEDRPEVGLVLQLRRNNNWMEGGASVYCAGHAKYTLVPPVPTFPLDPGEKPAPSRSTPARPSAS